MGSRARACFRYPSCTSYAGVPLGLGTPKPGVAGSIPAGPVRAATIPPRPLASPALRRVGECAVVEPDGLIEVTLGLGGEREARDSERQRADAEPDREAGAAVVVGGGDDQATDN